MEFRRFHAQFYDSVSSFVWRMDRINVGLYVGRFWSLCPVFSCNGCDRKLGCKYCFMIAQLSFFGLISAKKNWRKILCFKWNSNQFIIMSVLAFRKKVCKKSILVQLMFNICHADNIEKGWLSSFISLDCAKDKVMTLKATFFTMKRFVVERRVSLPHYRIEKTKWILVILILIYFYHYLNA